MVKQKKTALAFILALVVLASAFATFYFLTRPAPVEGEKTIHIQIVADGQPTRSEAIKTDADYLRGALEEQGLIEGDETAFGLMVKTVDGRTADESIQEWWCFTKDGEMLFTGVDEIPIEDGDRFEITLTVGWDDF
ncbi:MAG: DUF4430 domain-containing protein [Oscillospiraceae bacterium]|jgi:hypothetical protein|nr:DUF4430 domain-containing protein [Oscillospiraceae bacterium]